MDITFTDKGLKTCDVAVPHEGRDAAKVFRIVEMPAWQAEKWGAKLFLGLVRGGIEVPDEVRAMGMAGVAVVGLRALGNLKTEEAFELMDEMWTCIQRVPDVNHSAVVRALVDSDTMEVKTRVWLRDRVFELHVGFSLADAPSHLLKMEGLRPGTEAA